MRLELVTRKDVSYVHIVKEDKTSLGISVKDGKAGLWPVIKRIKARSLAERSHAVCKDDTLLSINGRNTMSMTRQQVKQLFKEVSSSLFELKLEYEMHEASILHSGVYEQRTFNFTLRKEDGTYGFILRKRGISYPFTVEYPVVGHIECGGPADKEGSLMVGDKLLRIDSISLSWLSLREIAAILHQKDEAEFFIEYKEAAINLPKTELNEIELEIRIPNVDLGITLAFSPSYPPEISVDHIRKGSLGERCGVLSEGDVILAINGVRANCLTPSKANNLMHMFKKEPGKLLYRSKKWKRGETECASSDLKPKNSEIQSRLPTNSSPFRNQNEEDILLSSPNLKNSENKKCSDDRMNDLNQDNKLESIEMFQNIFKNITQLKWWFQNLCSFVTESKVENFSGRREACKICQDTGNQVTVCYSCLSYMNSLCCDAIDSIRNIAINFVDLSENKVIDVKCESPSSNSYDNFCKTLLETLASTLPKKFWDRTGLKEQYDVITENVLRLNFECKKCKDGIIAASCLVQKLLLIISLNDKSSQIEAKIDQLVSVFSGVKIPCGDCSKNSLLSIETVSDSIKKNSKSVHKVSARKIINQAEVQEKLNNIESQCEDHHQKDVSVSNVRHRKSQLGLNLLEECVHFKPGTSSNSADLERSCTSDILNQTYRVDNDLTDLIQTGISQQQKQRKNSLVNENIKAPTKNSTSKVYKEKGLKHSPYRSWKSEESVLASRLIPSSTTKTECFIDANSGSLHVPPESIKSHHNSSSSRSTNDLENGCSSPRTEQSHSTTFTVENRAPNSSPQAGSPSATHNSESPNRVRQEIMNVKLIVEDYEGFGIGLGFMNIHSTIPVITSIKAKSIAKRVGILSVYDRVLAINGRSVIGLSLRELETVKEGLLPLKQVTLTVEFDVNIIRMKFGVFNVHLKRNLVPGFLYEDTWMAHGTPLRLKGIVKGSAAHRSGEVFVGDEILFLKCQREEEFDPINLDCNRSDSIMITVRRKVPQTTPGSPTMTEPLDNPISGMLRQGSSFRVMGTNVRLLDGQTVVEFRVRLFRDPKHWDFGFLVGEKPGNSRAYVTAVREGGPAHESGVVKKFDKIIEVDGVEIGNSSGVSALSLLMQANERVDLLVRRMHHESAAGTSESLYV